MDSRQEHAVDSRQEHAGMTFAAHNRSDRLKANLSGRAHLAIRHLTSPKLATRPGSRLFPRLMRAGPLCATLHGWSEGIGNPAPPGPEE